MDEATKAILESMGKREQGKPKAKSSAKAKAKAKPASAPKLKPKVKQAASPKTSSKKVEVKVKHPHFADESSRNQFMCRTGLPGPKQTVAFKYNNASSKAKANKLAQAWVDDEKKKRNLA